MRYFYSKQKISRLVGSIAFNDKDIEEFLGGNPFVDYPNLNNENTVISEIMFKNPTWTGIELRDMTDEELKVEGILELQDGEYIRDGKLIKVEYDTELGYLKPTWNKETHIWEEKATEDEINLHIVESQYNEYAPLDTYSTVEQMERQDPAMKEEYVNMMIELRELRASMQNNNDSKPKVRTRRSVFSIHTPSEKLKLFKEKFSN